jgi:threonyl-tRNA synthetase
MKIKFNNEVKNYADESSLFDVAKAEGVGKAAVCARINGKISEMRTAIADGDEVSFVTFDDEEGKNICRHSASHILAQAIKRVRPDTKLAIGPAISTGFYYDFDFSKTFTRDDIPAVEAEMKKIIKANYPFVRKEVTKAEALKLFENEPYKIELINGLPQGAAISVYTQGEYTDLCVGPHIPSTGYIKAYKLTSVTGAYWRGDEHNKMLTRVYGTAFEKKEDLDKYLAAIEDAKKRDHNKIGRELGYFMTDETIGQGLPLFMPKGAKLFQILTRFVEDEEERRGYVRTKTPYMAKRELYKISGHWDHYLDSMFVMGDPNAEGEVFALRPMTCPFQYTIYNNGLKSYRDLPMRYGETSTLFRNESSGEMHGLIRVRQFTISEGHLICRPDQIEKEFKGCLELARYLLKTVGLDEDVSYRFSRWDPKNTAKYINDPAKWEKAEGEMEKILKDLDVPYTEAKDEAAFYGPKLDIQIKNVYGKEDTLVTIQIDMFLAENFDMNYVDENGEKKRPYIIHRTSIGCYERTIALILEKFGGALPTWLSPTQVKVLSLTERTEDDAKACVENLKSKGVRAEADLRNEKIGYKIREAQLDKVPYMIIIGDNEKANGVVSVRSRKSGDAGTMKLDEFIAIIDKEVKEKTL